MDLILNTQNGWIYRNFNSLLMLLKPIFDFFKFNVGFCQVNLKTADTLVLENPFSPSTNEIGENNLPVDFEKHYFLCCEENQNSNLMSKFENKVKDMTIVIVADNADLRKILSNSLSIIYNCIEISNVKNGYDLIVQIVPDIVISDVVMSKMDGFELCERIKENSKTCHIPIILLTGQNTPECIVAGYEKGADVCVSKPFKMTIISAQILQLIKNRKLIREKYLTQNFMVEISHSNLTRDEEFIVQLRQILEDNISNFDFNVHELSYRLNMSKTTLNRKVKLLTGFSPVEFLLIFKMQKAYKLLSMPDSIKAIGYSLGFKNLSYFSRCFKKQFGVTPLVFRQKGLKKDVVVETNQYHSNVA